MKITFKDACKTLGLTGTINAETVKAAFVSKAFENHPDRGGTVLGMQLINSAHDALKDYLAESGPSHIEIKEEHLNFAQEVNDAINAAHEILPEEWNTEIQLIGSWAYLFGTKSPYISKGKKCPVISAIVKSLMAAGWAYNGSRECWVCAPKADKGKYYGKRKRKSTDELRDHYGCVDIKGKKKRKLSKAS